MQSSEFKIDEFLRLSRTLNLDRVAVDDPCSGYHILLHPCTLPQGRSYTESISNNLTIHCDDRSGQGSAQMFNGFYCGMGLRNMQVKSCRINEPSTITHDCFGEKTVSKELLGLQSLSQWPGMQTL